MAEPIGRAPDENRVRALFVDDDEMVRELMRATLAGHGIDVVLASDGREATRLFESDSFDIVITDLFMPEEDGLELIARLRRRARRVPIIAISGGGNIRYSSTLNAAGLLGADVVLQKPFSTDELALAIRRVLEAAQ
jgi:DNA-binding response OmpR family regulator